MTPADGRRGRAASDVRWIVFFPFLTNSRCPDPEAVPAMHRRRLSRLGEKAMS